MFKINDNYNWLYFAVSIVIIMLLVKQCEGDPRTIIETKTEYIPVKETITETKIDTIKTPVYVDRIKTVKGKDSIIYRTKPDTTTTNANKYKAQVKSNNAVANLEVVTTGELLDITGTIDYNKEVKTIEKTVIRDASGLFIYAETSVMPTFERAEIGLDYQLKNKIIIGSSISYHNQIKATSLNVKVGIKIF